MLRELRIGDMVAKLPIIQGGMGVGVSLSRLAGAVAKEGGVGVISTAQIGFEEPEFEKDQAKANLIAIKKHIKKAKELACGHGMVGVNIMVALKHYKEHVLAAVEAGADVIISGAGLPMELPELVDEKSHTRIAPIVSSKRAANLILKMWAHRYNRTADFIVIEGPKAGGHLGFSNEQLADMEHMDYDSEIKEIISCAKAYEEKFKKHIPVIVAGGVFTHEDVMHCMELGADGVQVASRFVATEECDASDAYKHAYLNANESDVQIIQSPVGMPGRAVRNGFPAADCGNQFIKAGYLSDVRKLVKQKADMNRQFAVVFVVCFITKQIEKLRLQNSNNKIKGVVGIAHYEEKRGFPVA